MSRVRIGTPRTSTGTIDKIESGDDKKNAEKEAAKQAKEAEKQAKEELKRINELEESKINIMADGHEKELALIRLKYKKKIDEIRGNGETEKNLRIQLATQCEKEVADCELKYQQELAKINLENRLASVEDGSAEELTIRLAMLERKRQEEVKAAEKTGADVSLIEAKYAKEREKLQEDYAKKRMDKIEKDFAAESETRDTNHILAVAALQNKYAKELAAAGKNQDKRKKAEKKFLEEMRELENQYARETAENTINMYEKMLGDADLSLEDRMEIERKIAAAKAELEKLLSDIAKENGEDTGENNPIIPPGTLDKISQIAGATADLFSSINDMAQELFDAQIERIEEMQEALTESSENELERITELVEKKVITEEEGEARKRAAEAATAKKQEELEKKKQQLKIKQAKWDKANSLAQATMSTALAVMSALNTKPFWLGIAMAAIAGAMGAVQIATIAATPIPAYAEGTDYHKGGPAIVGDGGRSEVVLFNGGAWLTPDTPTLVDIPQGASVIPDVMDFERNFPSLIEMPLTQNKEIIVSPYNDEKLRKGISELIYIIRQQTKQQRAIAARQEYELFKSRI